MLAHMQFPPCMTCAHRPYTKVLLLLRWITERENWRSLVDLCLCLSLLCFLRDTKNRHIQHGTAT